MTPEYFIAALSQEMLDSSYLTKRIVSSILTSSRTTETTYELMKISAHIHLICEKREAVGKSTLLDEAGN